MTALPSLWGRIIYFLCCPRNRIRLLRYVSVPEKRKWHIYMIRSAALQQARRGTLTRRRRCRPRCLSSLSVHSQSGSAVSLVPVPPPSVPSSAPRAESSLLRDDPAHSAALGRLVRTLLHAPSAAIDSSLVAGLQHQQHQQEETTTSADGEVEADANTMAAGEQPSPQVGGEAGGAAAHNNENTANVAFVSDWWGELNEAPLNGRGDAPLAAVDDETALLRDQEAKHVQRRQEEEVIKAKRRLLHNARRTQAALSSLCSPQVGGSGRPYRPHIHVESTLRHFRILVAAERDDHPIMRDFGIEEGLYVQLILAMPKRFLVPKMEVLRQYVAAVEARARREQQRGLDEEGDSDGSSADGADGEVGLVLDLDARALYNCCESPGTYAHRLRKRGTADQTANASILDSICYLGDTLINTPPETQHYCLPRLMASALTVRSQSAAWTYAADIFWHMDEQRFPIDSRMYNHIMCNSTFRSTPYFPFWKVLKVLSHDVEARKRVDMCDVIQLLLNHFPYTDAVATKTVMRSMLSLHQPEPIEDYNHGDDGGNAATEEEETISFPSFDDDVSFPLNCNAHADRGVLQAVAYAGAAAGDPDMVLMAWDLADQAGYSPSAEMYESTVTAFSRARLQDHNVFAALCEMEEAEIPVSRALIESVSTQIGFTPGRIKNARFILTNGTEGTAITTASLNVIMAALGGRGDTEGSFETFALFEQYGIEPNADTYAYMLESLATYRTAEQNKGEDDSSPEDASRHMTAAREVVKEARNSGISASGEILHQYLRTLCAAGLLEETVEALKEAVERDERVLMESFSLIAVRHAKGGDFDTADYICKELYPSACGEEMPRNVIGRIINLRDPKKRRNKQRVSKDAS